MGNIFKFEIKQHLRSVFLWVVSIVSIQFMMMALYPTFSKDVGMAEKLLENYPEEMLKAFGMSSGMSLSTVAGYLVFSFAFIQLCLAIQSAYLGFSILSKEERELTADFLMSKPVKRHSILTAKLLAAMLSLFLTLLFTFLSTYISIELFRGEETYEMKNLVYLFLGMHFFQWLYLFIGLVISVSLKKIKNVLSFALALSLGTYVLNAMRAIVGGETLGWLTPFYYFDLAYILENAGFRTLQFSLSIILILTGAVVTYYVYTRRNIASL